MKLNLVALTAVAAFAAAAPERSQEHQLEVRDDLKVDQLTFYGWDGQAQEITDEHTVYYNDPGVLANSGNQKRTFSWIVWRSWWWWGRKRCNWCWVCRYWNGHGGCQQGRCCC